MPSKYNLFDVVGVELEYMIVGQKDMAVAPLADVVLRDLKGQISSDVERGKISWSNELVSHVIELKTTQPVEKTNNLSRLFHQSVLEIHENLNEIGATLLPGGMHPTMDPFSETKLWPHEYNEIYTLYNRVFDCRGHGWSNVQSTHINLPFNGDEQFKLLHAAIRMILPIIPGLTAASPLLAGELTGFYDTRLDFYQKNQQKIPSIAGEIVPEPIYSHAEYDEQIFKKIRSDIKPFDTENILKDQFLNSRGAIARFDRGAIEIRLLDIQESPRADIAAVNLIVGVIKDLVSRLNDVHFNFGESQLKKILLQTIETGELTEVRDKKYLMALGFPAFSRSVEDIWFGLYDRIKGNYSPAQRQDMELLLSVGTLAGRMIKGFNADQSPNKSLNLMKKLNQALLANEFYLP